MTAAGTIGNKGNTNFRDYTGQRFGKLVVVKRAGSSRVFPKNKKGRSGRPAVFALWLCICDCGKESITTSNRLGSGKTKSCGCSLQEWKHKKGRIRVGYGNGFAAKRFVFGYYTLAAKNKDLQWELTKEEFLKICTQDCHYCGIPPYKVKQTASGSFIYNGVDRKNNLLGYTSENSLPCCEICNLAKRNLSYDEFVSWLKRAGRHQNGELQSRTTSS